MIIDNIKNAHLYFGLGEQIQKSLEYILNNNLKDFDNGKYEIDGDKSFIIVQDYHTKPLEQGKFEAHRKYIDIQFIISGAEKLGYLHIDNTTPVTEYDAEKDIIFLEGQGVLSEAKENDFLIFMPQDAHMPCIEFDKSSYVKKAVVKIKV